MVAANSGSFCLNKVCIILFEFELVASMNVEWTLYHCATKSLEILYMMVNGLISNVYSGI